MILQKNEHKIVDDKRDQIFNNISSFSIEISVAFLVIFSPFIHAGVTLFPLSVIEITGFALLLISVARTLFNKERQYFFRIPFISLFLFIILILFQLLSMPRGLIQFLSPNTAKLYSDFSFIPLSGESLTVYGDATIGMALQFLSFLAIFYVVINYFDSDKKIERLVLFIIISGFAYAVYGIVRRFAIEGVGFSTFTNRNHFSAYIQMVIPLTIGYALVRKSFSVKMLFIFSASTMLLSLLLALSRAGIVCIAASLLILSIILRIKYKVKKETGIVILMVLSIAAILAVSSGFDPTIERLKTLLNPLQALSGRITLLKDTLNIIKDFPLFGIGFGALGEIFQKYKTLKGAETFSFTHNEPLQLMAETGLFGFLLIAVFIYEYIKEILGLLFKRRNPYVVYLGLGALFGIISIFLHSLFDFVFHIPANAVYFVILLALTVRILSLFKDDNGADKKQGSLNTIPVYIKIICLSVFVLSFSFLSSLIINRYNAEKIYQEIKDNGSALKQENIFTYHKRLKSLNRAINFNPLNSSYYNKRGDIFSELALRDDFKVELMSFKEFGGRQRILRLAEESYRRAIELNPTRADYHLRLGWFYGVLGEEGLTKKEFEKAQSLDPENYNITQYIDEYFNRSVK